MQIQLTLFLKILVLLVPLFLIFLMIKDIYPVIVQNTLSMGIFNILVQIDTLTKLARTWTV